ncbi:MAG: cupin domain-containing protein [Jatrophihabitans sp.]|uniref:cupin domain-containing protein n=1 Tax=Jatrophihabitans sp. TaxID=1932789 RepID=UPI003F7E0859
MSADIVVSAEELQQRTILRKDLKADRAAFLDTKIPGSEQKINYPLIGPGVSENPDQVVPVTAPHGFNLGAAVMPAGVINNLHLHFTAEVFMCLAGQWQFRWGVGGADGEATVSAGDVISIPTWIFRGFTSLTDDAWLYTALGRDHSGGLIWEPSVIERAASTGRFLTTAGTLVDVEPGTRPEGVELVAPLDAEQLASLPRVGIDRMRERLATPADLVWDDQPFLCSVLPGGGAQLALVIGHGLTENRLQHPRLTDPHGLSLAWLRAEAGQGVARHRHGQAQALIVKQGRVRVTLNEPADAVSVELAAYDTLSVPRWAWRTIESVGDEPAEVVAITEGDDRVYLDWAPEVVEAALAKDVTRDPNGYLAPASMLPRASV